jgi:hypothetical protein
MEINFHIYLKLKRSLNEINAATNCYSNGFRQWLNAKLILYLGDLADPKTRFNSIPNHHTHKKKRDSKVSL